MRAAFSLESLSGRDTPAAGDIVVGRTGALRCSGCDSLEIAGADGGDTDPLGFSGTGADVRALLTVGVDETAGTAGVWESNIVCITSYSTPLRNQGASRDLLDYIRERLRLRLYTRRRPYRGSWGQCQRP